MHNLMGHAGLILISLAIIGCSARPQAAAPPAPQIRPRSSATLAIVWPEPGATISGTTLHVRLRLEGAQITPQVSTHLRPDRGHVHLLVDGRVVSMAYGLEQDIAVVKGPHLLTAEFVAQDHFPFNPRVIRSVTFTVR
ncbi:MAG TPA: hypothetical protein VKV57_11850 [bacterium]|nr:hypothetical protein [bacterium]